MMIDRIESAGRRWYIAFTGNSLGSVLSAIETGLGLSVLPVATVAAYDVRESPTFGVERSLVISVYAWEESGTVGELVRAICAILSVR